MPDIGTAFTFCSRRVWASLFLAASLQLPAPVARAETPADEVVQPAQFSSLQSAVAQLRQLLADQQSLVTEQSRRIEAQGREIEALRRRLEAVPTAGSARVPQAEPVETRLEAVEQAVKHLPELPEVLVTAGDFPGSIRLPGTDAAFKIGGQARFTLVHTLEPLGSDDRFIASSIPVGSQLAGEGSRVRYIATPTRVNVDVRWPSPFGGMRTFVESDFAGSENSERLRHAYIQTNRWLFGQTWSTFSDPEADPMDIDFEGLNAISRLRQAQFRYTHPLRDHFSLALALENPAPDLTGAQGINLTPDFVARVRWDPEERPKFALTQSAHIQGAILVRTLRGALTGQPDVTLSTGAFGVNVSGVVAPRWASDDRIKFATNNGWGIGRYITDLAAEGGQDAVYDLVANQLRGLSMTSGYVDYERRWNRSFLSTFSFGIVSVNNLDIQSDDALHRTQRGAASITWNPVPRADVIFEVLFGERVNKDGEHNGSSQIQAGWKLRF
jgi:hypothetical protein